MIRIKIVHNGNPVKPGERTILGFSPRPMPHGWLVVNWIPRKNEGGRKNE